MDSVVTKKLDPNAIYSALFTPFDSNGDVDAKALEKIIKWELDKGIEGFYCCGSSGEGILLTQKERELVTEVVANTCGGEVPFIVHVGSLNTKIACDLAKHAQSKGACAVSAIPPIYYHYTQDEINSYYLDIATATDLGVIVYNIPQFTGISFTTANPLLSDKRIIGLKHTSMNLYDLERIGKAYPEKVLINGFDEIFLSALSAGATATIGTTVNFLYPVFGKIREAFNKGDITKARELQHRLNDAVQAIVSTSVFPAAKYSLTLLGVDAGICRKPFAPLTEEQKKTVKTAIENIADLL